MLILGQAKLNFSDNCEDLKRVLNGIAFGSRIENYSHLKEKK